jgi:hypothetical protein
MRPSEDTRERALADLRRGYVAGRLGTETFSSRVELALGASAAEELRGLTADLEAPPRRTLRDRLRELLPAGGRSARLPPLDRLAGASLLLGRSSTCQLVLSDDTVSRRHAELRVRDGTWFIRDLGSSNGTWVNGRRVVEAEVAPGDELWLGDCRFRL